VDDTRQNSAIMVCPNNALNSKNNGMSIRVQSLMSLLELNDIHCTLLSQKEFIFGGFFRKAHLGIMVGFSSGWLSVFLSKRSDFLWLDAMDSRNLLNNSSIRKPERQVLATIRESLISLKHIKVVTFISNRDKEFDAGLYGDVPVYVLPNKVNITPLNAGGNSRLVFVGPADYKPNLESVKFLAAERIENRIVDDVYIIGKGYRKLLSQSEYKSLIFLEDVNDKDLYWENDIHLAPLIYGAGIKNKVTLPLLSGLRVVGTQEAFNGLNLVNNMFLVSNLNQFARMIDIAKASRILPAPTTDNLYVCDQTKDLLTFIAKGTRD